jgi:hypothetical protein
MIEPIFYRNQDTLVVGISCPDCPEPNLVHSICVDGLDLLATLQIGQKQYFAWAEHRREVHGEILVVRSGVDDHLGGQENS